MAFSQTQIVDVRATVDGPELFIAWSGPLGAGEVFQVYVDRSLAWSGTGRRCHCPIPAASIGRNVWVEVGVVDSAHATDDYSATLQAQAPRSEHAELSWRGGTYLDPSGLDDVQQFWIYRGATPGAAADMTTPVDKVVAYPGGWINDGFAKGGFGESGFGRAGTDYSWQSGPLASGTWQFAVVAVDRGGNPRGQPMTASVVVVASPRAPASGPSGRRLASAYGGASNPFLTLSWLASPSEA